jgi:hypothetical protein
MQKLTYKAQLSQNWLLTGAATPCLPYILGQDASLLVLYACCLSLQSTVHAQAAHQFHRCAYSILHAVLMYTSGNYVSHACSVDVVFTHVAGCRQQYGISMVPAALLACLKFLFYMHCFLHFYYNMLVSNSCGCFITPT